MNLESLISSISKKGKRITPLRRALLEVMTNNHVPFTVPELQDALRQKDHKPNKTTLYRQLEALIEIGIVEEMSLGEGLTHYEIHTEKHHHHFICQSCKSIKDFASEELEKLVQKLEKSFQKKGHEVQKHSINLFGTCSHCLT